MSKFKRYAIIIVVSSSLLLFCCIGYWTFKGNHIVANWQEAQALYQAGKMAQATARLEAIVAQDLSHEKAFLLLGKIAEEQKKYLDAAYYYAVAGKLNEVDLTLPLKYATSLFKAGQYESLNKLLYKKYEEKTLSDDEFILFVESMAYVGNVEEAREILKNLPDALQKKLDIKLIKSILMVRSGDTTLSEKNLEPYLKSENPHYRWIANFSLAEMSKNQLDSVKTENYYLEAYKINPEKTVLPLADFYKVNNQLKKVQTYIEESQKYYSMNFEKMADLGEIYATENNDSELTRLKDSIKLINQESIETHYYLDAILKYLKGDYSAIAQPLQLAQKYEDRGFYIFLKFLSDAVANRVEELPSNLNRVMTKNLSDELRNQIESLMMMMLGQANQSLRKDDAAKIATQILRITPKNSAHYLAANQTLAITSLQENDYSKALLAAQSILDTNSNSILANGIMAEALFATQAYEKSLPYFEQAQEIRDIQLKYVHALLQTNHKVEAESHLKHLLQTQNAFNPDVFSAYINFLTTEKRFDEAKTWCQTLDTPLDQQYIKNKTLADLAWAQNKDTHLQYHYFFEAIKNLEKCPPSPEITYNIAYLYASMNEDQKASELYESLLKTYPAWDMVLVNLSEVKAALGDDVAAYEYASRALSLYPNWEFAQRCMKRRKPIQKPLETEPQNLDSIIEQLKT